MGQVLHGSATTTKAVRRAIVRTAGHDPDLTRSSLHRCLARHGIGRLPDVEGDKPPKKKFKSYPIGFGAVLGPMAHSRLTSPRHRRGADRPKQVASVRCHRPHQQARLNPHLVEAL